MDENAHWVERIAERIVAEKKQPYSINSGMTTSGPVHLGTLCEFLYPSAIRDFLVKKGSKADFTFQADIMDAFDGVPASIAAHSEELTPHLGKPLCRVPDPLKCHKSFGEHFLDDALKAMKKFGIEAKILRADEMYASGKYDKHALLFFERLEEVKKAVYESSLRQELPKWWSPIMPVCKQCGKIATTRVTAFDPAEGGKYDYACDRIVKYTKGCGHSGSAKLKDHEYKITWRLDWPARQDFLGVSAEGGGVDQFTRGGSWDTAVEVHRRIFKKEPPVGYKFGFVLLKGKKYSKSKGDGMGVTELVELIPPEVLKYALLRPDVQENKDIDTTGDSMLRLCEDYLVSSKIVIENAEISRADRKRSVAFSLATPHGLKFTVFSDILLYYQLYRDWKKTGEATDAKSAEYLKPYVETWIAKGFMPEEYAFAYEPRKIAGMKELMKEFAEKLQPSMKALDIHNLVFDLAREKGEKPEKFFEVLYETLINKPKGPKMGRLVEAVGVLKVKNKLLELCSA
ncbi:MAG: lysine--tRNA ligase [Candidatus Micrarchaeia archaeon]|jgi:lysyl-tRNA synthetase class 1